MTGTDSGFTRSGALKLVALGSALFVALLWMIGANVDSDSDAKRSSGHAMSPAFDGYAGLADLLRRTGHEVVMARDPVALRRPGVLILTPPLYANAKDIAGIVEKHRAAGPTVIVLPKWFVAQVPAAMRGTVSAKKGWVARMGSGSPGWVGQLDLAGNLDARIDKGNSQGNSQGARWSGMGLAGPLADGGVVQSVFSTDLVPLVTGPGEVPLVAYLDDGSAPQSLIDAGSRHEAEGDEAAYTFPLVLVGEPDLVDNYGLADLSRARLALRLVDLLAEEQRGPVTIDLTLNGFGGEANLLTLAFTPPFLAATLCLLLAALVVGWRAFMRFGPPRAPERAIAFGKRALVTNAAGLVRRSRRLHLVGAPYVERARERLTRALALPRSWTAEEIDGAIDRALAARDERARPFSLVAARLSAARAPHELIKAARELHALERTLIR